MRMRRLAGFFVIAPLCLLVLQLSACRSVEATGQTDASPSAAAGAGPMTFDFRDPKGVNAIGFFLDSEIEPITGFATGISGSIEFDPALPSTFSGALVVDAGKIQTSNPRMTSVLQGADWIDFGNHLEVRFEFDEVLSATRTQDNAAKLRVRGRLSIRGVAIEQIVDITTTHIPGGAARRGAAESGDLLVLRSRFVIDRTAFQIKPEGGFEKVARDIQLNVAIVGYSK